jgi:hypothetical protein
MSKKPASPSLEQRNASVLNEADPQWEAIATLINETEAAAQEADTAAEAERAKALDPAIVVDAAKVGAAKRPAHARSFTRRIPEVARSLPAFPPARVRPPMGTGLSAS